MAIYCISKIRNEKGIIEAYILKNNTGETATIEHDELKRRMQTHRITVENLQISKDNRIVDKAIEKDKGLSKSKLQITVEKMVYDIKNIIHEQVYFAYTNADNRVQHLLNNCKEKYFIRIKTKICDNTFFVIGSNKIYVGFLNNLNKRLTLSGESGVYMDYTSISDLHEFYTKNRMLFWQIMGIIDSNAINKFRGMLDNNDLDACTFFTCGSQSLNNMLTSSNLETYDSDFSSMLYTEMIKKLDIAFDKQTCLADSYVFRTVLNTDQIKDIRNNEVINDYGFKSTSQSLLFCIGWGSNCTIKESEVLAFKINNTHAICTRSLFTTDQYEITLDRRYGYSKKNNIAIHALIEKDGNIENKDITLRVVDLKLNEGSNVKDGKIGITHLNINSITQENYIKALYQKILSILSKNGCNLSDPSKYYSYIKSGKCYIVISGSNATYYIDTVDNKIILNKETYKENGIVLKLGYTCDINSIQDNASVITQYILNNSFINSINDTDAKYFDLYIKQYIVEMGFDILVDKGFGIDTTRFDIDTYTSVYKYVYYINGNDKDMLSIIVVLEYINKKGIRIKYRCKSNKLKLNNEIITRFKEGSINDKHKELAKAAGILFKDIVNKLQLNKYNRFNRLINYTNSLGKLKITKINDTTYTVNAGDTLTVSKGLDWAYYLQYKHKSTQISGYHTIFNMNKLLCNFILGSDKVKTSE